MSEDRITLDPPKPPLPERQRPSQTDPAFVSTVRSAFGASSTQVQDPPRPTRREQEELRLTPPPEPRAESRPTPRPEARPEPRPAPRAERSEEQEEPARLEPSREVRTERKAVPVRSPVAAAQEQNRERARRVARMKFSFYKLAAGLFFVNILFFCVSYLEVQPSERFWWIWPGGVSLLALIGAYFRAFVLKGRSIQGYIDAFLSRIEEREVTRELDRM